MVRRFFGVPGDRDFILVPLLANSEASSGPCVPPGGGRLECYSIIAHVRTDSAGFPVYDEGTVETLVNEFGHGYVNPLGNARRAEFERSAPRVHAAVADAMEIQAYPWMSMVNESILRAAHARYHVAHRREDRLREVLREQRAESWLWLEELSNLLGEYEADRRTYPTLDAFMPRVAAFYDSLPDRLPADRTGDAGNIRPS